MTYGECSTLPCGFVVSSYPTNTSCFDVSAKLQKSKMTMTLSWIAPWRWRDWPNISCDGCRRPRVAGRKRCCHTSKSYGKVPTNWCNTTTSCSEKSYWKITKPWKNNLVVHDIIVLDYILSLSFFFIILTYYVLMILCLFEV